MYTEEQKRKSIEETLIWIGETSDFDIMSMAEQIRNGRYSFSGSLSKYELSSCLRETITTFLEGEFDASFVKLRKFLYLLIDYFGHDSSTDSIRKYAKVLNEGADKIDLCDVFIECWNFETDFEIKNAFPLYEGKINFNAYDTLSIKKSIDGSYFHLYKYRNGGELPKTDKYKLCDGIIASDNLLDLISDTGLDDTWGVTIGLYLEKKIDLSYFVITFSLNGNVFVLTDKIIYKNPDQINRTRNGGRRLSEDREKNLDFLPYILIDKVIEKRASTKSLVRKSGREVWVFPLEEYFCENIYFILKYTIQKIQGGYTVRNVLGAESNNHLLTSGNVDMSDDSHFLKINMDRLNALVDEIYGSTSTALVAQKTSLIEQLGVSTELMTAEEIETSTQYMAHKQVAENHEREKWGDLIESKFDFDKYKEYDTQRSQLMEMFKAKSKDFEKYLFAGEKVMLHDIDNPIVFNGFDSREGYRYTIRFVSNTTDFGSLLDKYCLCGDGHEVKKEEYFKSFSFARYTEFTTLLGITRKDLPPLFRDYLAHYYLPYIGNSILDNVKPEFLAMECDYVSRRNPNNFIVSFPYCGFCHKKLYKKYKVAEEAVIVISSKQNAVIEILPKDDFVSKYIEEKN